MVEAPIQLAATGNWTVTAEKAVRASSLFDADFIFAQGGSPTSQTSRPIDEKPRMSFPRRKGHSISSHPQPGSSAQN